MESSNWRERGSGTMAPGRWEVHEARYEVTLMLRHIDELNRELVSAGRGTRDSVVKERELERLRRRLAAAARGTAPESAGQA